MKISVLVPVFKVEKYIERCAASLFTQTDTEDVEFIFVNDCTPDGSIDKLKECIAKYKIDPAKVKIVDHEKNKGLAGARNTGLDYATGEYILLLDSDDTLEKDTLKILKETIDREHPDMVVFGMQFIYPDGTAKIVGGNYVPDSSKQYIHDILTRACLVTACGKLFKKTLFNDVRFVEGLNYGEDYATLPRLVHYADRIANLSDRIFYNYYQDNANAYTKVEIGERHIGNICQAVDILTDFFTTHSPEESKCMNHALKIRNKVFLLEYVSKPYRKNVLELYPEVDDIPMQMPLKHKIVWELGRKKRAGALDAYLDFSQWLKNKFHI